MKILDYLKFWSERTPSFKISTQAGVGPPPTHPWEGLHKAATVSPSATIKPGQVVLIGGGGSGGTRFYNEPTEGEIRIRTLDDAAFIADMQAELARDANERRLAETIASYIRELKPGDAVSRTSRNYQYRIHVLEEEIKQLRASHVKLHRRAQQSERIEQAVIAIVRSWESIMDSAHRATSRKREDYLFKWALREITQRIEKIRHSQPPKENEWPDDQTVRDDQRADG